MITKTLASLLLLFPLLAKADWYQAEGSAPLSLGTDTARQQALEQALSDALLQSGASLSTVQSVTNGAFAGQQLDISAQGELMDYLILNERRHQGRLWLTVRADIWPGERRQEQCAGRYRPGMTLAPITLKHPQQGAAGQIYELGTALTTRLASQLEHSVNITSTLAHGLDTDPALPREAGLRRGGDVLAGRQQSRLLLSGIIDDISIEDGHWTRWTFGDIPRAFSLGITLEDGLTGDVLLQRHYQTRASWDYGRHDKVNVHEQGFWQSGYGQAVEQLLANISQDVIKAQACLKAVGNIVQQSEEGILMDLGRREGIQPGDRFTLTHRRQLTPGYYSETASKAAFVVQQSHADYSLLVPAGAEAKRMTVMPGDRLIQL
ncbi:flagellar assembly protein T N-terminal domain-containing protein [Oceanimonas sp. CHS3-5]|uniref:flagellar assembly protein T N-terminal domain-containing protein n=1 Tax=Oceanimonas sp. CHS3-5 TaxID=3068186 RepID=UPI00273D84D5|nr:flagellar assembly protein T N-terminal domain-containing protein [Oceanimonas sp. CHS3-5]MDP5292303.1 flagellar assembly protein T N-terminal domain-containing protein [Oceanimonas sp. CHS3-5]